jgi:3-methyladenine DNA glycosylase/8-oxoguanine DNA glycosylase
MLDERRLAAGGEDDQPPGPTIIGPTFSHAASLHAWPTPREILRAGDTYLTQVCRLGYRSASILRLCREVCEGRFDPDEIERLAASPDVPSDELVKLLRRVHGVGPSSAHYMLSFLGRHDRMATDSSTVAHVRRTHTNGRKPTFRQIERIYAPYGRWKNLVWWFEYWLASPTGRELAGRRRVSKPEPVTGRSRAS